jgi:hypothetical protein
MQILIYRFYYFPFPCVKGSFLVSESFSPSSELFLVSLRPLAAALVQPLYVDTVNPMVVTANSGQSTGKPAVDSNNAPIVRPEADGARPETDGARPGRMTSRGVGSVSTVLDSKQSGLIAPDGLSAECSGFRKHDEHMYDVYVADDPDVFSALLATLAAYCMKADVSGE